MSKLDNGVERFEDRFGAAVSKFSVLASTSVFVSFFTIPQSNSFAGSSFENVNESFVESFFFFSAILLFFNALLRLLDGRRLFEQIGKNADESLSILKQTVSHFETETQKLIQGYKGFNSSVEKIQTLAMPESFAENFIEVDQKFKIEQSNPNLGRVRESEWENLREGDYQSKKNFISKIEAALKDFIPMSDKYFLTVDDKFLELNDVKNSIEDFKGYLSNPLRIYNWGKFRFILIDVIVPLVTFILVLLFFFKYSTAWPAFVEWFSELLFPAAESSR